MDDPVDFRAYLKNSSMNELRMVKFARTPEYSALFSGDPQWVTESIAGMGVDQETILTERETLVLSYLIEHSEVGPLDLTKEYGASPPTWSRVKQSAPPLRLRFE